MGSIFFMLQSCCFYGDCHDDDFIVDDGAYYSAYEPVYYTREALANSVTITNAVEIIKSGKIYVKDNLLFVGDDRRGFHVFDNTNAQNPVKLHFIQVPGATDLAIRENVLYINQATDLITVQYNNTANTLEVTKRVENVFPEMSSPDGWYAYDKPENSVVVNWILKD